MFHGQDEDLQASIDDLGKEIEKAKHNLVETDSPRNNIKVMNAAMEMVVNVAVGGALGYFLDDWLGTTPFLFIILFFLGVAAGALTLYKRASKIDLE